MKRLLQFILFTGCLVSLPATAHIVYTGHDFGVFNNPSTVTLSNQAVKGNSGWINGVGYGDSHHLLPFRFTLSGSADVTLTFKGLDPFEFQPSYPPGAEPVTTLAEFQPGFSLYSGLTHTPPHLADYDSSVISIANRPDGSAGSFNALGDWKIGNDDGELSFLTYIGHVYDGVTGSSIAGADGLLDGLVSLSFAGLAAGDYSIFVGGANALAAGLDYFGLSGTLTVDSISQSVSEPGTHSIMLLGLVLLGIMALRPVSGSPVCKNI
ncbi:PEP-CTERM sorting domain-containing protein [Nitrosomonas sp. HPC101]|uniref:PEP-CTERM sorting domain-containing protein n=1 Tax=Nitrosomonas sp. HPC101 TaxID=1658667 RepID=UPI00136C91A8|nr:PEP-CTERM sorting domain-containing protein [Nitrosomonas sp. HPC101]MXS85492.1 PEP-CTERM sorting domain-containing protein [Nitrosomonas sp. HPC101]